MRISVTDIIKRKGKDKITALAAYDYSFARLADGEVDIILVGDSLGMVVHGMDSTLPVTLELMLAHTKAVMKAATKSLVVVDLPFGSYQKSPAQAFKSAAYLIAESGAQAVKLEGGAEMAKTVKFLTSRGIPVMGHIGLMPQSFNKYGGFKIQGRTAEDAKTILDSAKKLEAAGCFAFVLEGIKKTLADDITAAIKIPTIGIGASPGCDGQVLVLHDMLGLNPNPPKFVKAYTDLKTIVTEAVKKYSAEVKTGKFPTEDNCY